MLPQTPVLTVNLTNLRANYRLLKARHAKGSIAAVVKADAYGLGVAKVAPAFWDEGCRIFFVATLAEGVALRKLLPDARIGVFNGLLAKEEKKYLRNRLTPVLCDPGQAERWAKAGGETAPAILHVDTGMTRLGFTHTDFEALLRKKPHFAEHNIAYLMSHLACANEAEDPKNAEQLMRFRQAMQLVPRVRGSLCNSSGLFLSDKFHFDMARPGCALYGINPVHGDNPMLPVASLCAPILQLRQLDRDETVGYGATYKAKKSSSIAIMALGYADGWMRTQNQPVAFVDGVAVPYAGRVSMDMIALDVTGVKISPASRVEFMNSQYKVDDVALQWNTIGYEVLTGISKRVEKRYITD